MPAALVIHEVTDHGVHKILRALGEIGDFDEIERFANLAYSEPLYVKEFFNPVKKV